VEKNKLRKRKEKATNKKGTNKSEQGKKQGGVCYERKQQESWWPSSPAGLSVRAGMMAAVVMAVMAGLHRLARCLK
jgi:hypothetical protein